MLRAIGKEGVVKLELAGLLKDLRIPGLLAHAIKDVGLGPNEALMRRRRLGKGSGGEAAITDEVLKSEFHREVDVAGTFSESLADIRKTAAARTLILQSLATIESLVLEGSQLGYGEGDDCNSPRQILGGCTRLRAHLLELRQKRSKASLLYQSTRGKTQQLEAEVRDYYRREANQGLRQIPMEELGTVLRDQLQQAVVTP